MQQTVLATQSTALRGAGLPQQRHRSTSRASVHAAAPQAIFGRKSSAVVVEEAPPAPPKRGFFGRTPSAAVVEEAPRPSKRGLFGRSSSPAAPKQQPAKQRSSSKTVDKAAAYE
jgi:hypothetical protein